MYTTLCPLCKGKGWTKYKFKHKPIRKCRTCRGIGKVRKKKPLAYANPTSLSRNPDIPRSETGYYRTERFREYIREYMSAYREVNPEWKEKQKIYNKRRDRRVDKDR